MKIGNFKNLTINLDPRDREDFQAAFVVGSGLTSPTPSSAGKGVPGPIEMINLLGDKLQSLQGLQGEGDPVNYNEVLAEFRTQFATPTSSDYSAAFKFMKDKEIVDDHCSRVVRKAVLGAYSGDPAKRKQALDEGKPDSCIPLELNSDPETWVLRPGIEALGSLVWNHRRRYGRTILTTNFDPLIEVAIRRAGGSPVTTRVDEDGSLQNTDAWLHVVHVHGHWHGSRMLHTYEQISAVRPKLENSLKRLLNVTDIVVIGYGGWYDSLMRSLSTLADNDTRIHWCFYEKDQQQVPPEAYSRVMKHLGRNPNATLYFDIDCDEFLPRLNSLLSGSNKIVISSLDHSRHIADLSTKCAQLEADLQIEKERTTMLTSMYQDQVAIHRSIRDANSTISEAGLKIQGTGFDTSKKLGAVEASLEAQRRHFAEETTKIAGLVSGSANEILRTVSGQFDDLRRDVQKVEKRASAARRFALLAVVMTALLVPILVLIRIFLF